MVAGTPRGPARSATRLDHVGEGRARRRACRTSTATPRWCSTPSAVEALPCGSRSMTRTRWPSWARRRGDVDRGGGLADAALLVGDDDHAGARRVAGRVAEPRAAASTELGGPRQRGVASELVRLGEGCRPCACCRSRTSRHCASGCFTWDARCLWIRPPWSSVLRRWIALVCGGVPANPGRWTARRLAVQRPADAGATLGSGSTRQPSGPVGPGTRTTVVGGSTTPAPHLEHLGLRRSASVASSRARPRDLLVRRAALHAPQRAAGPPAAWTSRAAGPAARRRAR